MRTLQATSFCPALVLGLGLLATAAQAQVGPGVITTFAGDAVFNSTNLAKAGIYDSFGSNRGVVQINMTNRAESPFQRPSCTSIVPIASHVKLNRSSSARPRAPEARSTPRKSKRNNDSRKSAMEKMRRSNRE